MSRSRIVNKRVAQGQTTRAGLVAVAQELFARRGYEATSIPAVLEAAGVSRGALYHHFASKEALFEAVVEAVEIDVTVKVARATRGTREPLDALRRGCAAYVAMCRDPVIRQVSLVDAPAVLGWARWRELDARHAFGTLKASVAAIAAGGRLKPDLVDVVAHMILAALMEVALLVAREDDGRLAVRRGQAAIDELLTSLFASA